MQFVKKPTVTLTANLANDNDKKISLDGVASSVIEANPQNVITEANKLLDIVGIELVADDNAFLTSKAGVEV